MADLSITKNYSDGNALTAAHLTTAFTSVEDYINARRNGVTGWDALTVTGATVLSSTLAVTGVSTFTGGITTLFGYRRPNLVYISTTNVDVENNTGTSNQTMIVFPDGTYRSVTEDTSSTDKYRRFNITATAEFTSGTEDSGLRSGISEATNTWYAIYAVKSTIDATKFVLSGDTTLPTQSNYSTLNSRYGTNGWIYLGLIRNGDNASATGDILNFKQSGSMTIFEFTGGNLHGTTLATNGSTSELTYSLARGTGQAQVPNNISLVKYGSTINTTTGICYLSEGTGGAKAFFYFTPASGSSFNITTSFFPPSDLYLHNSGASATRNILLSGWIDGALSGGVNPIF